MTPKGGSKIRRSLTIKIASIPECDVHASAIGFRNVPAVAGGKTFNGVWAYMCAMCFETHGVGLGPGLGKLLMEVQSD